MSFAAGSSVVSIRVRKVAIDINLGINHNSNNNLSFLSMLLVAANL